VADDVSMMKRELVEGGDAERARLVVEAARDRAPDIPVGGMSK